MPRLTVVAGANGAGKSTLTKTSPGDFQFDPLLDPDSVALRLRRSAGSQVHAAREVLRRSEELLDALQTFAVETTLSGHTYLRMMETAQTAGYTVRLIYIGTTDVSINMKRVRDRVTKGGHNVLEGDQLRRYARSFANLQIALRIAEEAILLDNSTDCGYRRVALKQSEKIQLFEPIPEGAAFLRQKI